MVSCQRTRATPREEEEEEEHSLHSTSTGGYNRSAYRVGTDRSNSLEMTDLGYSLPVLSNSYTQTTALSNSQTQTTPFESPSVSPCPEDEEEEDTAGTGDQREGYDVILAGDTISVRSPDGYTQQKVTGYAQTSPYTMQCRSHVIRPWLCQVPQPLLFHLSLLAPRPVLALSPRVSPSLLAGYHVVRLWPLLSPCRSLPPDQQPWLLLLQSPPCCHHTH